MELKTILALLWAGLIHEDSELTLEDVAKMIDITMLGEISKAISGLFSSAKN